MIFHINIKRTLVCGLLFGLYFHCSAQSSYFPHIIGPIQITDNGHEHLFASYYGINSWSAYERYATVLETDVKFHTPKALDTATIGLIDMVSHKFIPVAKTTAWNLQQGCMAHWLATNPDSVIIYNDRRNGKFVSVILNVLSHKELKVIPYPVAAISHDGKEALSINFSRLKITREDYGYAGEGQDAKGKTAYPDDDGIFLVNLYTGSSKMIVSIKQLRQLVPRL
jgi:hypothetical protein